MRGSLTPTLSVGFGEGEAVQHIRRAQPEDHVFGDDRPREGVAFRLDELDRGSFDCVWRKMRAKLRSG
jgi:tRNA G46 methylase TrmB